MNRGGSGLFGLLWFSLCWGRLDCRGWGALAGGAAGAGPFGVGSEALRVVYERRSVLLVDKVANVRRDGVRG